MKEIGDLNFFIFFAIFGKIKKMLRKTKIPGIIVHLCLCLRQFLHFYYCRFLWQSLEKNLLTFAYFWHFLQMLQQLKTLCKYLTVCIILVPDVTAVPNLT